MLEIKLKANASSRLPFVLSRKQFPVRLSFAITINKSQGQTIPNVGVYLPRHIFSHGQLYVALSRGVSQNSTKVLIKKGKIEGEDEDFKKNVVFKDFFLQQSQQCFFYIICHLYIYVMMLLITIRITINDHYFILILYSSKLKYVEFENNFVICLDNILFINQYINNFH